MDVKKIREDFPILSKKIDGKPLIYFDSACTSLKPRQVIDAVSDYYTNYGACVGRSIHQTLRSHERAFRRIQGEGGKVHTCEKLEGDNLDQERDGGDKPCRA